MTSRRGKKTRQKSNVTAGRRPPSGSKLVEGASAAVAAVEKELAEQMLPAARSPESEVDEDALFVAWQRYDQAKMAFQNARKGLDGREQAVAEKESALAEEVETLAAESLELEKRTTGLDQQAEDLNARRSALDKRDEELLRKELELTVRGEREKEEILAEARETLAATLARVEAERAALDEQRERGREQLRAELEQQRQEIAEERLQLADARRGLRDLKTELDARTEDLDDLKALYAEQRESAVAAAIEHWKLKCRHLEESHRSAREHADMLEQQLAGQNKVLREFGDRQPQDVLNELSALAEENAELRELRRFGAEETVGQLTALQEERRHWTEERNVLLAENQRLQRQLAGYQMSAVELDRAKVTREAAEATVKAYRATVEDLKRDMADLVERKEGATPFPACSAMDEQLDQTPEELVDDIPSLRDLVTYIRSFIAQQHQLYYTERDIRCLLAGMATSRLHLLQGISGIGKTQLPQRFAEALGASSAVISVGADWRTPQDLMGYYNAFERKFYESEFTQALYQAQCPRFANQPFFIVLDEMNLSYPEQYFNDILSAMELAGQRRAVPDLVLMSAGIEPAPRLLKESRKLPLAPNVWFVGTANHDETTVSFADKTYDRAHVIELPAGHARFQVNPVTPLGPVSFAGLSKAFDAARSTHGNEVRGILEFLEGDFAKRMSRDFQIAWGSRLRKQVWHFATVVLASGGTLTEAADHLVATKVLRKLRGRHEVRAPRLESLRDDLRVMWADLDTDAEPVEALRLLDEEIHQRGEY